MERPTFLSKYLFDWELINVVIGGKSALDSKYFVAPMFSEEEVGEFLLNYGIDNANPVDRAELFGNFQEALQFIRRYFLKEGNPDGLDFKIPNAIIRITDISELFLMATNRDQSAEERLWAEVVLKVMHTILHIDKDLRSRYFSVIQTQIFDRFYKYVFRDNENNLFLGEKSSMELAIPLIDFETKAKKTRDSVIIKLLHKVENVAEELFDRVGIRFVTETRFDSLRVIKFLLEKNIIVPHNIKPSRSSNSMIDLAKFKIRHQGLLKMALRSGVTEAEFLKLIEQEAINSQSSDNEEGRNRFSSSNYQSIQFTCRQLIKYENPFLKEFSEVRKFAKGKNAEDDLVKKILSLDITHLNRDIRFFYPFEVQIADKDSHKVNTEGEASHAEYKKNQVQSARNRVMKRIIEFKQ